MYNLFLKNKHFLPYINVTIMNKYPKIGIRPTIDGRQGGIRESLEEKTMNLAKAVAELISSATATDHPWNA